MTPTPASVQEEMVGDAPLWVSVCMEVANYEEQGDPTPASRQKGHAVR